MDTTMEELNNANVEEEMDLIDTTAITSVEEPEDCDPGIDMKSAATGAFLTIATVGGVKLVKDYGIPLWKKGKAALKNWVEKRKKAAAEKHAAEETEDVDADYQEVDEK